MTSPYDWKILEWDDKLHTTNEQPVHVGEKIKKITDSVYKYLKNRSDGAVGYSVRLACER